LKKGKNKRLYVSLSKNNIQKMFLVYRLVAEAFINNPDDFPQINHKDCNPSNNCVDNLEWCTAKYNINYETRNEKCAISQPKRKSIKCLDLKTNEETNYSSIHEASRQMNLRHECIW